MKIEILMRAEHYEPIESISKAYGLSCEEMLILAAPLISAADPPFLASLVEKALAQGSIRGSIYHIPLEQTIENGISCRRSIVIEAPPRPAKDAKKRKHLAHETVLATLKAGEERPFVDVVRELMEGRAFGRTTVEKTVRDLIAAGKIASRLETGNGTRRAILSLKP